MSGGLTQRRLKQVIVYAPLTGLFFWKDRGLDEFPSVRTWKSFTTQFVGRQAGAIKRCQGSEGYVVIRVDDCLYRANRLAFLYVSGKWPTNDVDHVNHLSLDNRWSNLRDVSNAINHRNSRRYSNNTSGTTGVGWMPSICKWRAYARVDYKDFHLGVYESKEAAASAAKCFRQGKGFSPTHGEAV